MKEFELFERLSQSPINSGDIPSMTKTALISIAKEVSQSPINSGDIPSPRKREDINRDTAHMSQSPINSGDIPSFSSDGKVLKITNESQSPINSGDIPRAMTWTNSKRLFF